MMRMIYIRLRTLFLKRLKRNLNGIREGLNANRNIRKRVEKRNYMIHIHYKEVNNTAKRNLLHDIINPPKLSKSMNNHYYPILHVCMNTRKGRAKFMNFRIILGSGYSFDIVMRRLVENYTLKKML